MSKRKRISFFGGPGSGKSTTAPGVFHELKKHGYDVEYVNEFVKTWAYEGRMPQGHDQAFIFANQLHSEEIALRHVDAVITDSPLLLNTAYSRFYNYTGADELISLSHKFEAEFPALNLYIKRTVPYVQKGRFQSEEEAKRFDNFLLEYLDEQLGGDLITVTVTAYDQILEIVKDALRG